MDVEIDKASLHAMGELLDDAFIPTLEFCMSEFDRLHSELLASFGHNNTDAMRHAHSLKSNAAQFGAKSLAALAKEAELAINENELEKAKQVIDKINDHLIATKQCLQDEIAQLNG